MSDNYGFDISDNVLVTYYEDQEIAKIPYGVTKIAQMAFNKKQNLKTIIIPETVAEISTMAIRGCNGLERVVLEGETHVFNAKNLNHAMDLWKKKTIMIEFAKDGVTVDRIPACLNSSADYLLAPYDEAFTELYDILLSRGELPYLEKYITAGDQVVNASDYSGCAIENKDRIRAILWRLFISHFPVSEETQDIFVSFLQDNLAKVLNYIIAEQNESLIASLCDIGVITNENLKKVQNKLKKEDPKYMASIHVSKKEEKEPEDKITAALQKQFDKLKGNTILNQYDLNIKGIKYKDNGKDVPDLLPRFMLAALLSKKMNEELFKTVTEIAVQLDLRKIYDIVFEAYLNNDGENALAIAKPLCFLSGYVGERNIIGRFYRDFKKPKFKKEVMNAIILSDSIEARKYIERENMTEKYEALHKSSRQLHEVNEYKYCGLDEKGEKQYDLGNDRVILRLSDNFSFLLLSEKKGKTVKTLPKAGADPDLYETAKTDIANVKKNVTQYGKDCILELKKLHISAASLEKKEWEEKYVSNPISMKLSNGLIWFDGKQYFILKGRIPVNIEEKKVEPGNRIYVANAVALNADTIEEWQDYIVSNHILQPFEQIWEPVINMDDFDFKERYKGLYLTLKDRNNMKKELSEKGIDVYSDTMKSEFDHQQWKYEFANHNAMHFGNIADVEYDIHDDNSITITDFHLSTASTKESLNAIAFALEKQLAKKYIMDDSADKIIDMIDEFTFAQIESFIRLALDNQKNNALSAIMNYKNSKFAEIDPLNEFILDF